MTTSLNKVVHGTRLSWVSEAFARVACDDLRCRALRVRCACCVCRECGPGVVKRETSAVPGGASKCRCVRWRAPRSCAFVSVACAVGGAASCEEVRVWYETADTWPFRTTPDRTDSHTTESQRHPALHRGPSPHARGHARAVTCSVDTVPPLKGADPWVPPGFASRRYRSVPSLV